MKVNWLTVLLVALCAYAVFQISQNIVRNDVLEKKKNEVKSEVEALNIKNARYKQLLAFYETKTFVELEARSRLALKKPGEQVYILKYANVDTENRFGAKVELAKPEPEPQTNTQRWRQFFFTR